MMKTASDIIAAVSALSDRHILHGAPPPYVQRFADAAVRTFEQHELAKILQEKFHVPDDARFSIDSYLQSAAELSVQNHLLLNGSARKVVVAKRVNPPKDVDAYYEIGATRVSLEVKCAIESHPSKDSLVFQTAGRVADHLKKFAEMQNLLDNPNKGQKLELAKNKDNTMRDFLVSSHKKFSPDSGIDDLNILLVACEDGANIQDWWYYLYGNEGLFTAESFYSTSEYQLVDVVLLSSLKYLHQDAREFNDWTLHNSFILPCVNPHSRSSSVSDSVKNGLSVFDHHLTRFSRYTPEPINSRTSNDLMEQVKVRHYIVKHLEKSERARYFPVKSR